MPLRRRLLLVFLAGVACGASGARTAEDFEGTVVSVTDGDSVWVRPAQGGPARAVRLLGLDAPESCQAHGPQARAALAARVLRQGVRVAGSQRDVYDRLLARLATTDEADIGAWLVEQGHAWSWRQRNDLGPYAAHEARARAAGRGLWATPTPQEPRDFRREHGPCR